MNEDFHLEKVAPSRILKTRHVQSLISLADLGGTRDAVRFFYFYAFFRKYDAI